MLATRNSLSGRINVASAPYILHLHRVLMLGALRHKAQGGIWEQAPYLPRHEYGLPEWR